MPIKSIYKEENTEISLEDKEHIWSFYNYLLENKKSENTANSYELDVRHFAEYLSTFTNLSLAIVKSEDVEAYISWLKDNGKNSTTIHRTSATLIFFYEYMYEKGNIENPLVIGTHFEKKEKKKTDDILAEQEINIIQEGRDNLTDFIQYRDYTIVQLILNTGMRNEEVINLRLSDIDLNKMLITCGKAGKGRIIPIDKPLIDVLRDYINIARKAVVTDSNDIVFVVAREGVPLSRWGLIKLVTTYCNSLGIEKTVTPKMLRDTFIVNSYSKGMERENLIKILGVTGESFRKNYPKI